MSSKVYVAIFGLSGFGKSTLARGILDSDGGGVNFNNYCVSRGGKYTFAGRYRSDRLYNGADSISKDANKTVQKLFKSSTTPYFFSEGVRVQHFGQSFLSAFYQAQTSVIIALVADYAVSVQRIAKRSSGRITNGNTNLERMAGRQRLLTKFESIGTKVYRIDANRDQRYVFESAMRIIRGFDELL